MATNYNFAESSFYSLIKGAEFTGRRFIITSNGTAVDLTDATIDIWFRRNNEKGKVIKELSETSGITVNDAAAGDFQIDAFTMDWNAGLYYYDIKIVLSSGSIKKYIWGTIEIKEDSTN